MKAADQDSGRRRRVQHRGPLDGGGAEEDSGVRQDGEPGDPIIGLRSEDQRAEGVASQCGCEPQLATLSSGRGTGIRRNHDTPATAAASANASRRMSAPV